MLELAVARGVVAVLAYFDIIGLSTFATNLLDDGGDRGCDRLRDLPDRPISGSPRRRRGSRSGLLHDVPRHGARHPGFRADHRRRDVLPALHPAAVLPDTRRSAGDRHGRHRRRGAHPGAGGRHRRQPLRRSRAQAQDADPGLAPDRHRGRAVARAHPRRHHRAVTGRPAHAARLHRPTTTTATTCPTTSRPTSDTPPRTGISPPPG